MQSRSHRLLILAIPVVFLSFLSSCFAQEKNVTFEEPIILRHEITSLRVLQNESRFEIQYDIPLDGVVEIYLFDEDENMLWTNQYAQTKGKNRIGLKKTAFNPEMSYHYKLRYKATEIGEPLPPVIASID